MPYSWCREPHVETQKLSRWSLTVLSRHLLLVHCQQHKHVHFMSFTMWAKECLRIWTWLPLKELIVGGSPASCPRALMPLACSDHTCQYAVTLLFSVAASLTAPFVTVEADHPQVMRNLSLQLTLFKVRVFGILGFLWATELPQLPLPCNVTPNHHLKSLRVKITEHISGPWKLVSKDDIQKG